MQNKTDKSECVHDAHEFGTFDNVTGKCWVCGKTYSQVTGEGNAPRVGQLKRDSKVVFEGSEGEAMSFVHRNHSFSYDHALKHEGFSYDTAEEISIRAAMKA